MKHLRSIKWIPLFFLLPLCLGTLWGVRLSETAYVSLRYGQTLAAGHGLNYYMVAGEAPALTSPLFVALAAILSYGFDPIIVETAVWLTSLIGWGCLAWVIYRLFSDWHRPLAGLFTAFAILLNPYILTTIGTEIAWTLAVSGLIVWRIEHKKSGVLPFGLLITALLLTHLSLTTVVFALLASLFFFRLRRLTNFFCRTEAIASERCAPRFYPSIDVEPTTSHFYFVFVSLGWGATAVYTQEYAIILILGWVGAGLGLAELIHWIKTKGWSWLERPQLDAVVLTLIGLPLLFSQGVWLNHHYNTRPISQWQQEEAIFNWLKSDRNAEATLFATKRLHYLTGQPIVATADGTSDAFYQSLILGQIPPDYLVMMDGSDWLRISHEAWFETNYAPLQLFSVPELSEPLTIWGHRQSAFDLGQRRLAQIESPTGLEMVGYRAEEGLLVANKTVQAELFFRLNAPLAEPVTLLLGLDSFPGGDTFAQNSALIPMHLEAPQQVFSHSLTVTLPAEVPYGAYRLTAAFQSDESEPLWSLYQDNDTNALDRASLGYLIQPWEDVPETAVSINAQFGEHITLAAYEFLGSPKPDQVSQLILHWHTSHLPQTQSEYLAFFHISNEAGDLVVNLNERLGDGIFPISTWQPVGFIRDSHPILLPADLPSGNYQLNIGLFAQDSGERMPIRDNTGQQLPNHSLPLHTFTINP